MKYIHTFAELTLNDVALVGGKNASLGEMVTNLQGVGIQVPNGFATTADAYWLFLDQNDLGGQIHGLLADLDTSNLKALTQTGATIRQWITHADLPDVLVAEIAEAYGALAEQYGSDLDVAVHSSATAEDLPSASFAGQQKTYPNIRGIKDLLTTCKRVYASLFTDRAISYRIDQGFAHDKVALSISIQKMVRADFGASGVMFTLDTETGFRDVVFMRSKTEYHGFHPASTRAGVSISLL